MSRKIKKLPNKETVAQIGNMLDDCYSTVTTYFVEPDELIRTLRTAQGNKSLRSFAAELGCSAGYLSHVYNGHRKIGPETLRVLGFEESVSVKFKRWR